MTQATATTDGEVDDFATTNETAAPPEYSLWSKQAEATLKQETGNVVEIENVMDGEAQGDRNGDPDVRVEVETCGNYEKRVRPVYTD